MKIPYQGLAHSKYTIKTHFLLPLHPCPAHYLLFITNVNSHFNTSFTLLGISLWQSLWKVSFNPFNHGYNRLKQILEPHWQANGTGDLHSLWALWKEKLLRISSYSSLWEDLGAQRVCFKLRMGHRPVVPGMGRTQVLLDDSVPEKWSGLRSQCGALKETGSLALGFQPQRRFWCPHAWPIGSRATSSEGWNVSLTSAHLNSDQGAQDQDVSMMLELSQRPLTV